MKNIKSCVMRKQTRQSIIVLCGFALIPLSTPSWAHSRCVTQAGPDYIISKSCVYAGAYYKKRTAPQYKPNYNRRQRYQSDYKLNQRGRYFDQEIPVPFNKHRFYPQSVLVQNIPVTVRKATKKPVPQVASRFNEKTLPRQIQAVVIPIKTLLQSPQILLVKKGFKDLLKPASQEFNPTRLKGVGPATASSAKPTNQVLGNVNLPQVVSITQKPAPANVNLANQRALPSTDDNALKDTNLAPNLNNANKSINGDINPDLPSLPTL